MISMLQRHAVQVLLAAGHTHAEVALLTTVSERTVRRIACEPPITGSAAVSAALTQSVGRPSKTAAFQEEVVKLLTDEPDLKTVEVLHRLRGRGYTGAKSAVYALVATVRPAPSRLLVRFEEVPVSIMAKCPEIIRLESPLIAVRSVPSLNARSGSEGDTYRADQGDICHDQGLA